MHEDHAQLTRRDALRGIGSTAAAAALAGCSSQAILGDSRADSLRYVQVLPPVSLDPIEVEDPWSMQAAGLVFQGLYAYDYDLNHRPVLADGRPQVGADGTTCTVTLADDARFQDDTRVTADDVKYSFEAPIEEETPPLWSVDMIESIRTPDDRTVEFSLAYPYPAFEHSLTRPVVPKATRKENAEAFGNEVVLGSGPYLLNVFKPGKYATFDAWPNYWGGDRVTPSHVKMVQNHAGLARTMSLKTGQSDIVERIQPKLWRATNDFPGARVASTRSFNYFYLGFNTSDEPMSSPAVREAVDYLFSMDEFVEEIVVPAGRRQHSPLPRRVAEAWNMPLEEWKSVPRKKNVDRAETMLKEELNRLDVKSWTPYVAAPKHDLLRQKLAQTVVRGLKEVGFRRARVKKIHWSEFREKIMSGDRKHAAMYVGSWAGFPDPDTFLYPLFHENMQGLTRPPGYNEQDVMSKIDEARRTRERTKRRSLYADAITTLLEDRVHLPAFTLDNSFGVKEHVEGFRPHPLAQRNPNLVAPDGGVEVGEQ